MYFPVCLDNSGELHEDVCVEQLVYVSRGKLNEFRSARRRRWWKPDEIAIKAKPPFVEVALNRNFSADDKADLDKVVNGLSLSDDPPRWYQEDIVAGEWVEFETKLNVTTLHYHRRAVIFWEPTADARGQQMLLHCSASGLLASSAEPSPQPSHVPPSTAFGFFRLIESDDRTDPEDWSWQVEGLVRQLNDQLPPATAAWMGGIARVTAVAEGPAFRGVVASPLFVRRIKAPQ